MHIFHIEQTPKVGLLVSLLSIFSFFIYRTNLISTNSSPLTFPRAPFKSIQPPRLSSPSSISQLSIIQSPTRPSLNPTSGMNGHLPLLLAAHMPGDNIRLIRVNCWPLGLSSDLRRRLCARVDRHSKALQGAADERMCPRPNCLHY